MIDCKSITAGASRDFLFRFLSRLQADCEYYLNAANRLPGVLWAKDPNDQITLMRHVWGLLPARQKPEWLTAQQIDDYDRRMNG